VTSPWFRGRGRGPGKAGRGPRRRRAVLACPMIYVSEHGRHGPRYECVVLDSPRNYNHKTRPSCVIGEFKFDIFLHDRKNVRRMRPKLPTFKYAFALSAMSLDGPVPVRRAQARQIGHVQQVPYQSVAGASNGRWTGGRTRHKAGYVMPWAPAHPRAGKGHYVFETYYRDRTDPRPLPAADGVRTPPQRSTRRQPTRKPGTLDPASASRHPGKRRYRVGTRNSRSIHRGLGHLQQCSRPALSTLGGGGNRTRVLQYLTRASPGAACSAFLSPSDHASKTLTGSAAVRCPTWPRDRVRR
jgi:hypothetical protein